MTKVDEARVRAAALKWVLELAERFECDAGFRSTISKQPFEDTIQRELLLLTVRIRAAERTA